MRTQVRKSGKGIIESRRALGRVVGVQDDRAFNLKLDELLGSEMTERSITVQRRDEVFARGIAQAADGLCCVFSIGQGKLVFVAARDRAADLDELMNDLELELRRDDC